MKLSTIKNVVQTVVLEYPTDTGTEFLNIKYRPNFYTVALRQELELAKERELKREVENTQRIADGQEPLPNNDEDNGSYFKMFLAMVSSWDLTDDNGVLIGLTVDALTEVPLKIINDILTKINEDETPKKKI